MFFNKFTTVSELGAEEGKHGGTVLSRGCDFALSLSMFSDDASETSAEAATGDADFEKLIKGEYKAAFNKKCQRIIDRRFKETKELELFKKEAAPLIDVLFEYFDVDNIAKLAPYLEEYFSTSANEANGKNTVSNVLKLSKTNNENEMTAKAENNVFALLPTAADEENIEKTTNGENDDAGNSFGGERGGALPAEMILSDDANGTMQRVEDEGNSPEKFEKSANYEIEENSSKKENSASIEHDECREAELEKRFNAALKRYRAADEIYKKFLVDADEVKALYPSLNLTEECENKTFCALVSSGVSLRDAYEASHKDAIIGEAMEYTARAVSEALSRKIMHRGRRVSENALSASSFFPSKRSVSSMSDGEIREILKKVKSGERITF